MATTSVTLRIPDDILEKIPSERGERSRAIVELLRKGLSFPDKGELINTLEIKLQEIEKAVESLKLEKVSQQNLQDDILQRLARLETLPPKPETQHQEELEPTAKSPKVLSLLQDLEIAPQPNDIPKTNNDEIPEKSQLMVSGELLNILRKEAPTRNWTSSYLSKYKSKKNAGKWHTIGKCRFKFSGQRNDGPSSRDKQWKYWVLYPFKTED